MTFHGGYMEQILFKQWNTQSVGGENWKIVSWEISDVLCVFIAFVGSWFLIFFVAILYEGLKTIRDTLAKREARRRYAEKRNQQPPL